MKPTFLDDVRRAFVDRGADHDCRFHGFGDVEGRGCTCRDGGRSAEEQGAALNRVLEATAPFLAAFVKALDRRRPPKARARKGRR